MGKRSKQRAEEKRGTRSPGAPAPSPHLPAARLALAFVALLALTALVFAPALRFGFTSLDDDIYTTGRIAQGLTPGNVRWAFSELYGGFYAPVTLLSHMADRQLYGDWAGGHHLTNLLLHLANTLLLLAFLWRATGAPWRSLAVAALFALHPLHVEPVVWISERKELLCTLFEFAALSLYLSYVRRPGPLRYALLFLAFALALLSKPMAVTFPFLLLLLDHWPLGRLRWREAGALEPRTLGRLALEKLPLFACIPVASWLTLRAQAQLGAISPAERLPMGERLLGACSAYGGYLLDLVFPARLVAYVPHHQGVYSAPLLAASALVVLGLSAAALAFGRRRGHLFTGWFWYLGTLVPVIGIVQVGLQASADRYTYVPLVGLLLLVVWGAAEVAERSHRAWLPAAAAGLAVLVLAGLSWRQVQTWRTDEVLYRRILRFYPQCPLALINLGGELGKQGRFQEAVECFEKASRLTRLPPTSKMNWCVCLSQLGRDEEAAECFASSLAQSPDTGLAYYQYAFVLSKLQRHAEAIANYRKAYQMKAVPAAALLQIGEAYRNSGLCPEARQVYGIVLQEEPANAEALRGTEACAGTP